MGSSGSRRVQESSDGEGGRLAAFKDAEGMVSVRVVNRRGSGMSISDKDMDELVNDKPYYFEADDQSKNVGIDLEEINFYHPDLFLKSPTLRELVDCCTKDRRPEFLDEEGDVVGPMFETGMYVEFRANDMQWKLARINKLVAQAPDEWDFDEEDGPPPLEKLDFFYNIANEGLVPKEDIRAPREGLEAIFGMRPWLWQQFTILQLERRLRFDKDHEHDYDENDNLLFAKSRFEAWLDEPNNAEFRAHFDKQPRITQLCLRQHLFTPFDFMDYITENDDDWDFDDRDISVYTYLGVLGSGGFMVIATAAIQIMTPLLLLYNGFLQSDGEPTDRFFVDGDSEIVEGNGFVPYTDFDTFCQANGRPEGKILIALVLLIYLCSVVPDTFLDFFKVAGGSRSTYSRINSLREIIWEQNDDTIMQQIGYKVDRYMNTGYICAIYIIMLFILLNTPIVLDVILNALAIQYIHQIDEELADADWFDEDNRWIRAGTLELVMQGVLRLRVLESPKQICKMYDIDPNIYKSVLGNKGLCNLDVARRDHHNPNYQTSRELLFITAAKDARENDIQFAMNEYKKKVMQFGLFSKLSAAFGLRKGGMFHRYMPYRVWSRWHQVLFLPVVPHELPDEKALDRKIKFVSEKRDPWKEFFAHIATVLTGFEMIRSVKQSIDHGHPGQVPLRILFGFLEIMFYLLELIFPFAVLIGFVFIPTCY